MRCITSLIVTHHNRLKNFLNEWMNVKYKFGNCCVIEIKLRRVKNKIQYEIDMIHEGFVDSNKQYYSPLSNPFEKISGITKKFSNILPSDLQTNTQYIFFLIRHAQSTHNVYNFFTKIQSLYKKDTLLTEEGKFQALEIGIFLKWYLSWKNLKPKFLFVSDLKRTRQTMTLIIDKIKPKGISEMIVLPCSHEISDGLGGAENIMNCDIDQCDEYCRRMVYGNTKLRINWDFYQGKRKEEEKCMNSGMLKNAIEIIFIL